jgi:DNA-directed RNA polymerase subunit H (RpoH/RPB5)
MDYESIEVLYMSRKTLLKILAGRGYNTTPYEKFGPFEVGTMAVAGPPAFRIDLERTADAAATDNGLQRCRVEYAIPKIKNRLPGYMRELTNLDENENAVDPATTELVVITLDPIVDTFHHCAFEYWQTIKLRVGFFQAHSLVNNPLDHVLVPKHEKMPTSQHTDFLRQKKIISKHTLPTICFHEDMIGRLLGLVPGDIVKITRPSPSAGEYVFYRHCKYTK